ncbi:hypothetical protein [Luteolibacter marinus]|uniref:hypothetical protein n=1 Tax=Luteolibacter marinus TaxID=2776705 RepID=UPI00186757AA|nr:hypothetical protein [Luteolibacter marinus]
MNPSPNPRHDRIKAEIDAAQTSLTKAGHHLKTAAAGGRESLELALRDARARYDAKRDDARHAGQRIKQWLEEAKDHAVEKIEDWKTDREIEKIEKDADRKEEHAADALAVAVLALLEAEVALTEALKARKLASDVAG